MLKLEAGNKRHRSTWRVGTLALHMAMNASILLLDGS